MKACGPRVLLEQMQERNRMAHGYFELDFGVVRKTMLTDLPELIDRLSPILDASRRQDGF